MMWCHIGAGRGVHEFRPKTGTYAHPMNDLTTAFAVPKSEGNARAEDVSKHSAVSRGEIAECGCEVVGRVGQVILSQSHLDRKQNKGVEN